MSLHSFQRILSIVAVMGIASLCPDNTTWVSVVLSVAIGHYLLSFYYAKRHIAQVMTHSHTLAACALLAVATGALYVNRFSLVLFFGVHHVFNEIYLLNRTLPLRDGGRLRASGIALNIFIYLTAVRQYPEIAFIPAGLLCAGLAITAVLFAAALWQVRGELSRPQLVDACIFEVLGFGLIAISCWHPIKVFHVALYHFLFWGVYPLPQMAKQPGAIPRYVALNVVTIAGGFLLSPISPLPWHLGMPAWIEQFRFMSYVHIMMSFAISSAHPVWITRWFRPRAVLVVPGTA